MRAPSSSRLRLALAACQTPREACVSEASEELRTVDALIAETRGNLDRGYALETEQEVEVVRDTCRVEIATDQVPTSPATAPTWTRCSAPWPST
jgi:hypothetical protein